MTKYIEIHGYRICYREVGVGRPIIFLHGNPTSSYFWRKIISRLSALGRCIAFDLIGMGDSDKLPDQGPRTYSYFVHRRFVDDLLNSFVLNAQAVLVGHNWGATLACDWAARNSERVRGLAHMESQFASMRTSGSDERFRRFYARLMSAEMERRILEDNSYITEFLFEPLSSVLTEQDRFAYLAPYVEPGAGRRPMVDWPREIPVDGQPSDVDHRLEEIRNWLAISPIPKLFIRPSGASIMVGHRLAVAQSFANQQEVAVPGGQFAVEEAPDEISSCLEAWLATLT